MPVAKNDATFPFPVLELFTTSGPVALVLEMVTVIRELPRFTRPRSSRPPVVFE